MKTLQLSIIAIVGIAAVGTIALILASGMDTSISPLTLQNNETENTDDAILSSSNIQPHPKVLINQDETALKMPLVKLASYDGGSDSSMDSHGRMTVLKDKGNLLLALYKGDSVNGTVIVVTVTDTGTRNITLGSVIINGAVSGSTPSAPYLIILHGIVIGCTGISHFKDPNQPNVVMTVECPYLASVSGPVILSPGNSFTAYINGNFKAGSHPVNAYDAQLDYYVDGDKHYFGLFTPFLTFH